MLARQYQLRPRVPPVHQRIALQCAKNISRLAGALPRPLTRTGHLPVLVELRCPEEDVVYRYQVNLPPSCNGSSHQQMNAAEAAALSQKLKLPCLVHGRNQELSSRSTPFTLQADPPQLVMVQDAVHVVQASQKPAFQRALKEVVSTFHYSAYAVGASKITHDHFMATLHEQQPSPLEFEMLWADPNDLLYEEQQQQQQPPQQQLQGKEIPYNLITNQLAGSKHDAKLQPHPLNGFKLNAPPNALHHVNRQHNQLQLNPTLHDVQNFQQNPKDKQQQPPRILNGYKQPSRKSTGEPNPKPFNEQNMTYKQRCTTGQHYGLTTQQISPPSGNRCYKRQQLEQAFYCDPQQKERVSFPNFNLEQSGMNVAQPVYAHQARDDYHGYSSELHRELQLRQKLEQTLERQTLIERHKYQRFFPNTKLPTRIPQELQSQFQWDCCHLCRAALPTTRNSLDHYLSRTHLRRIDSWLIRHSFVKSNSSEDMLRHLRSAGYAILHCELCDLKLTSVIHARQHFYGRRHRLVERHISKPNGEGYYDEMGRWVRTNEKWLICELCDVIVTSESQMAIHRAGIRHRKRERSTCPATIDEPYDGSYMYRINANGTLVPLNPLGYYLYLGRVTQEGLKFTDLNAAYYCEVCNITLNHLKSVQEHEVGRAHKKRLEKIRR